MKWLASILVGLCAAPLAAIVVGTAADSWATWLRVSTREGGAAYWMVAMALLAAVIALVCGICIARGWLLSTPNFWAALGTTLGWVVAATLVITGLIWLGADLPPRVDGRRLQLAVEARFPAGTSLDALKAAPPYAAIMRVDASDSRGSGYLVFESASIAEGRLTVPTLIDLDTSAKRKMLVLGFPDGRNVLFPLGFGAKPQAKDFEWSAWIPAASGEAYEIRYQVSVVAPPVPAPTREQEEAAADAKQEAAMRALAADAPLARWLVFTRYGVPQARVDAAIAAIRARPNFATEMAREMLDGDYESSRDALHAFEHMKPPPAELAGAVAAVGKQIAQSLRNLEKEPADSATYQEEVAGISTRFGAWMVATRALQETKSADFVPQLEEIIAPARRLGDVYAIRIDVVRVASFYLEKWAGIAPLPGDPPPR